VVGGAVVVGAAVVVDVVALATIAEVGGRARRPLRSSSTSDRDVRPTLAATSSATRAARRDERRPDVSGEDVMSRL
jgi:hypothetical protein